MNIPVIWLSYHEGIAARGYWDQGMLEDIFGGRMWKAVGGHDFEHYDSLVDYQTDESRFYKDDNAGAVVVLAARHHAKDVDELNEDMAQFRWVVLLLTGDEEHVFPVDHLKHPRMLVYEMTPGPDSKADRYLPNGYPPQAIEWLPKHTDIAERRVADWAFLGQVTHHRRRQCVEALKATDAKGLLMETEGFTQGAEHEKYYGFLAGAKIAPCPSGPATVDTFRLYEALEAACLPIADGRTPKDTEPTGYWQQLFGEQPPFPVVDDWSDLPGLIQYHLDVWPSTANRASAWWQGYKRQLVYQIHDDITRLAGESVEPSGLRDQVTVLIPSSPIPSNPSTAVIEETIASVRHHLPDSEIILMLDGVRKEQDDRRQDYEEYQRHLLWKCNHEWTNVLPLRFEEHTHQAAMTRHALKYVRTSLVMFVEHDTPLVTDEPIDMDGLTKVLLGGSLDLIRLHHEAGIHPEHRHMMLDAEPYEVDGVPLLRTAQWSQRPHLATTTFYRRILDDQFTPGAKAFIEDKMHSIAFEAYKNRGKAGWQDFRLAIYAPEENIKRSYHTDGRAGEAKYDDTQTF